jgi:diguanylate cyclase (GGDEF)-like protein
MPKEKPVNSSARRLLLVIRSAYWIALALVAAMTMASYILLQQMMAAQQADSDILSLASAQRALSQRIILLARAVDDVPAQRRAEMISTLRQVTADFERNYDELLRRTDTEPFSDSRADTGTVEDILYSGPYHLDFFSVSLIANGRRFVSAFDMDGNAPRGTTTYLGGPELAELDETVAAATLAGYTALGQRIDAFANNRLDQMLNLHRLLFFATIGVIVLVAVFIFRPTSNMVLRETDELTDARNAMAFIAEHDSLTGLHNRSYLKDHFDEILRAAGDQGQSVAAVQIDLDRFKQINDAFGHSGGDHVLVTTAVRMRAACRPVDLCVRLGGDEFIVLLIGPTGDDVSRMTRRLLSAVNEPIEFEGQTVRPGASAGVAVFPAEAGNARELIVNSDLALYAAKRQGGDSMALFSGELRRELELNQEIEQDLRGSIETRSFDVHFQPQIALGGGKVVGVEALVRWNHGVRGSVSPGDFIALAERRGLMASIGRIVFAKAITEAAGWHRAGLPFGRLALNVSESELKQSDFVPFLLQTLVDKGLPPENLALEIVESVILDDEKTGIAPKLRRLRAEGIHLELDDFGTGYASLTHVSPREIDRLKIDRRFVQNINVNRENAMIVRAITELASGLGIAVVAEGAETIDELDVLRTLGCDEVQGFAIAAPMNPDQIRGWLTARSGLKPKLKTVGGVSA